MKRIKKYNFFCKTHKNDTLIICEIRAIVV